MDAGDDFEWFLANQGAGAVQAMEADVGQHSAAGSRSLETSLVGRFVKPLVGGLDQVQSALRAGTDQLDHGSVAGFELAATSDDDPDAGGRVGVLEMTRVRSGDLDCADIG